MFQTLTLPSPTSPIQFQSPHSTSHRRLSARSAHRLAVRCTAAVQDRPGTAARGAPPSLYEVLRVNRDASMTEIKVAYRNLAKLYHPDAANGSDGRDFIEIHQAYETLSDPTTRAVYDMSIGLGGREGRLTAASFGGADVVGRRRSGFYTTRRWESDQCW